MIMICGNIIFNFINFCVIFSFFLTKLLVLVVLILLTFLTNSSNSVFLITSLTNTLFSLLKSTGVVSNFPISKLSTFQIA